MSKSALKLIEDENLDELEQFERGNEDAENHDLAHSDDPNSQYPMETYRLLSWSAIQFIRAPDSKLFFATVILMVTLVFGSIGLGHFVKLDIAVEGSGEVDSELGLKESVTAVDGVVTEVFKKAGDVVKRDELIAILGTDNLSEVEMKSTVDSLKTALEKLEQSKNPLLVELGPLNLPENKVFDPSVIQSFVNVDQTLRNLLDQQNQIHSRLQREIGPLEKRAQLLTDNLEKMKKSHQHKFLQYYIESSADELGKLKAQIATVQNQSLGKLDQTLTDLIHAVRFALGTLESYHAKHEIRAPIDGTIAKLDISSSQHMGINKVAATFLPDNSKFVAKLAIKSKDIAKIHVGQSILYKLDAYPYQRYGLFEGTVQAFDKIKTAAPTEADVAGKPKNDDFLVKATISPPSTLPRELQQQITFVVGITFSATIVTDRKSIDQIVYEKIFNHMQ